MRALPRTLLFVFTNLICLGQNIVEIWGLKCKCDICKKTNYTCETTGYCFASTYFKNGVQQYDYSNDNQRFVHKLPLHHASVIPSLHASVAFAFFASVFSTEYLSTGKSLRKLSNRKINIVMVFVLFQCFVLAVLVVYCIFYLK
ncbi:unnamed protein product [Acanthoscelides obtectus]|uniref:Uncharacterized protein n=1 Tax=Acanthoscelides obtectus TaxID=200917 RepID=A0A9P0QA76_ACAOB|nr:unnamed protein product [Acanthoscelides obtectus]CAK1659441.1 hypothetical protein AOBTE_LOCUS21454 [Acanthoscelides obtectus]